MIDSLARILRTLNARLIGENRRPFYYLLKIPYAVSVVMHRTGIGRNDGAYIIRNFDGDLSLKINRSWSMSFAIYWSGFHEFHEFLFLHRYLKPGMVFVDAGANIGEYTLFAAKRVVGGRVLSFEPMPSIHLMLKENVALNHFINVQLFNCGLSDKPGVLALHEVADTNEGLSSFFPREHNSGRAFEVPLETFDSVASNERIQRLDFIKMDIEGSELYALRGARESIEKFRPAVMIEISEPMYNAAGYTAREVFSFFEQLRYQPFEITKYGSLIPAPETPFFKNIVFLPQ